MPRSSQLAGVVELSAFDDEDIDWDGGVEEVRLDEERSDDCKLYNTIINNLLPIASLLASLIAE